MKLLIKCLLLLTLTNFLWAYSSTTHTNVNKNIINKLNLVKNYISHIKIFQPKGNSIENLTDFKIIEI